MNAIAMPTIQAELPIKVDHITYLGSTKYVCIQPDCDREHHVWCSCAH